MQSGPMGVGARFLFIAASVVVVVAGLKAASALILPFLVAVLVAMISLPFMKWLQRNKVPRWLSVLMTVLADLVALGLLAVLIGQSLQSFAEAAPRYQVKLQALSAAVMAWLRDRGIELPSDLSMGVVNPGLALDLATRTLKGAAAVLSNTVLIFIAVVFILFEAAGLRRKLEIAFGSKAGEVKWFVAIQKEIQLYLGIKTLVSVATGTLVAVALALLGVDFPLLWGLLAFLMNYIPSIGSILAAIPPILLCIVQYGAERALGVALVFLAVNLVLGTLIEPHLMGRQLGLSVLVIFMSLVFWGWVWGPVGMLLSVPLTMIVKIMLENTRDLQWIAVLLEKSPVITPDVEDPGR